MQLKEEETPKLNNENAPFLNVASLSLIHLAFTIFHNYKPLVDIMQKYDNFDDFMKSCGEKTIKEVGL